MFVKEHNVQSKSGNAMVFVVLAFALIMIFAASIAFLFSTTLTQTVRQEEQSKAYYIAISGVDLAKSALAKENSSGVKLVESFWNSSGALTLSSSGISQSINIQSNGETIGTAVIRIDASGTGAAKQVIVTSTGTHTQSGATRVLKLKLTNIDSFPYMNESWE
jgi:type II secretory pathway component PulK